MKILVNDRLESVEAALAAAIKTGEHNAEIVCTYARTIGRMRNAMWRALRLARQGRPHDAMLVLETELAKGDTTRKEDGREP
ncbi:MAG: hypothetical protein C5B60_04125 [Chloroflexi bacterium]|nr:MAG: hypothetical protein C5B60_04125 [Chloroflexota bacterium]